MATEFTMPKLGLTMTDGTIREWLVPDGTMVNVGDPVLVIETDKVETEVEAREAGILSITGAVGENYECGEVIAMLVADGEAPPSAEPAPTAAPVAAAEPAPVVAATEQASVAPPQPAPAVDATASAEPAPQAVAARGDGGRILASPRARAAARNANIELSHISGTGPGGRIVADDVTRHHEMLEQQPAAAAPTGTGRILASPRARSVAAESGVDLATIVGTGPGGRIVADDVLAAASAAPTPPPPPPAAVTAAAPPPPSAPAAVSTGPASDSDSVAATSGGRMLAELLGVDLRSIPAGPGARLTREDVAAWVRSQLHSSTPAAPAPPAAAPTAAPPTKAIAPLLQEPTQVVPFRGMRGVIAERMHDSLTEMAQLTLSVDVDMSAVNVVRQMRREADETPPGYTAWVVAAASRALVEHPYVNSQVTADGVAYLPDVNVGVAVALDDGLIVPVVGAANTHGVEAIHTSVADLASRARDGKLKLHELEGGTFSVTALGMYGVDMFTPVINPPNTAILGVGRIRTETRWVEGAPTPVSMMTLSLTWDHRAFDGAPAAEFAQKIVAFLENPTALTE
jgi:pyruvate/2-oxoglutarate dehydrogenase complex dihydrolipoamide acyltransferase (E2) component